MGRIPEHTISAFVDMNDGKTSPGQSHRRTSSAAYNVYEVGNVMVTGLPIGYSVIVALTGLPIGYSVIVALTVTHLKVLRPTRRS